MQETARTEKQIKGSQAEQLARQHLERQGLDFIESNFLCKTGEIDLIMQDADSLVFVEVRYRQDTQLGNPLETVTYAKQRKLIRTASFYLQQRFGNNWPACRFDVIGISGALEPSPQLEWIRNAFGQ